MRQACGSYMYVSAPKQCNLGLQWVDCPLVPTWLSSKSHEAFRDDQKERFSFAENVYELHSVSQLRTPLRLVAGLVGMGYKAETCSSATKTILGCFTEIIQLPLDVSLSRAEKSCGRGLLKRKEKSRRLVVDRNVPKRETFWCQLPPTTYISTTGNKMLGIKRT
ncbi:uncharacterized protein BDZ99DRAFT_142399 [Mytilinidion resinicola]|uniref:Uncharacterized protein n=1 Tax=Mytilinidion resinicola TaxID=574789 RepID=A0A6A6Y9F3_9PEZI|nr:uncharacterized protein BDZ99DRAFT_142399 [Mytilinidion resinicola]KAF2804755.1 hypothetical protein BDZ99DRAFT_142399 [Mytilinidion resinicola]